MASRLTEAPHASDSPASTHSTSLPSPALKCHSGQLVLHALSVVHVLQLGVLESNGHLGVDVKTEYIAMSAAS